MKKVLSVILAVIMLISLVACGSKPSTEAPNAGTNEGTNNEQAAAATSYKERVVIGNSAIMSKKDPHASGSATDSIVWYMTHDTLVDYDVTTGEAHPGLAESWEVDGLTYTFHLRQGVTFHNGDPCTAADVVYSLGRMAESSGTKQAVKCIVATEAVDDYTVKITVDKPNAEFLLNVGYLNTVIVSKNAIETLGEEDGAIIGTGAFAMTEWVPDDYVLLTRYDGYWGDAPVTKEVMFRKFGEASARAIALQTGEIDIDLDVAPIEAPRIAEGEKTTLVQVPAFKLVYLALNVSGRNEPLNDLRVRQALNYATNPDDFIMAVREGYATAPNGCIPVGLWGYSDSVKGYTYDLEKAKSLLADAGYGNGVDLTITTASKYAGIFEILQAQWALAGVNLTLETDDNTVYDDQAASGEYCIMTRNYNFGAIDAPLRTLWYTGSSGNRTKTSDPELDAKLDAALSEMDSAKRLELYADISQHISDLASFIPLYQDQLLIGQGKNVSGVVYGPVTNHNLQNIAVAVE